MQGRMKMRIHPEVPGDGVGLVDTAGARSADVEFLQRDHVRLGGGDDGSDPFGIGAAIAAAATMNIVGQDPEERGGSGKGRRGVHGRGTRFPRNSFRPVREPDSIMLLRSLLKLVFVAVIVSACYLLYRTWSQYSFDDIWGALLSIPARNLALGLLFAACSYFCLACNDWLGTRYAGKPLPFRQAALASFTGLSIGHNVGMAALSSGAVRYRFYSRWGLSTEEIAKIIAFCGATVALGLSTLGAIALYLRPEEAAKVARLDPGAISWIALVCLLIPILYVGLAAAVRKPLKVRHWRFEFPRVELAAAQVLVGSVNFGFVAACLHQMLSAMGQASYLKVAAASITANIAAIISHVPGGLGVLEATIVHVLPGAASIAAVVAYRVIYYFIPLVIGLPLLIGSEIALKAEDRSAA
jgi:hypothetical protein